MRLSWRHLALFGALATAAQAVLPSQFTYDVLVRHLKELISERQYFFCELCVGNCITKAREKRDPHRYWVSTYVPVPARMRRHTLTVGVGDPQESEARIPESECPDDCTKKLHIAIPQALRHEVMVNLRRALEDSVRSLLREDQAQAMVERSDALQRAADDVGMDHGDRRCKQSDGGIAPLKPTSPGNLAVQKGKPGDRNNIVPYPRNGRGPSSRHSGPPSARDGYATEPPFHTPLRIDPICVAARRFQNFMLNMQMVLASTGIIS
ncbi:MAG: hypothetical protein M1826_006107 [Phylliscum demangeonii]|nr:MAG: hypothetical protein M1826_006107 [Phylliscum demangeonii]